MKFLKILVFWIGVIIFYPVAAQNSEECLQNLSIFAEYAKVKNYDEAYAPWMSVRKESIAQCCHFFLRRAYS